MSAILARARAKTAALRDLAPLGESSVTAASGLGSRSTSDGKPVESSNSEIGGTTANGRRGGSPGQGRLQSSRARDSMLGERGQMQDGRVGGGAKSSRYPHGDDEAYEEGEEEVSPLIGSRSR